MSEADQTPAPKRRRPQFRLMLMLLLVTLFASILAWQNASRELDRHDRQWRLKQLEWKVSQRELELNYSRRHMGIYTPVPKEDLRSDQQVAELLEKIDSLRD